MSVAVSVAGVKRIASLVKIPSQGTEQIIPLDLTPIQYDWIDTINQHQYAICCKSRQVFISTATLVYALCWLMVNPGLTAGVFVDTRKKAMRFIKIATDWCAELGIPLKKSIQDQLVLQNGATLQAFGTISKGGDLSKVVRSYTLSLLWFSEFALYHDAENVFAAASGSATKNAKFIVESTSSGILHYFHDLWVNETWASRFYGFEEHETYRADPSSITDAEYAKYVELGFTRRDSAAYFDQLCKIRFKGETWRCLIDYPVIEAHAWIFTEGKFFPQPLVVADWEHIPSIPGLRLFEHATRDQRYLIGYDAAGGTGRDKAAIAVVNHYTGKIAAIWANNRFDIDYQIDILKRIYGYYSSIANPSNTIPISAVLVEENTIGFGAAALCRRVGLPVTPIHTNSGRDQFSKYQNFLSVKRAIEENRIQGDDQMAHEVDTLKRDERDRFKGPDDILCAVGFCLSWIQLNPAIPHQDKPDRSRVLVLPDFNRKDFIG